MIEFLDTEWQTVKPFTGQPVWKKKHPDAFLMKTEMIERLAQKNRLREIILNDQEILETLNSDIEAKSIINPVILKLDAHSRITLYDGHHRLLVALERKIEAIPVRLEQCESLSLKTTPVLEVLRWSLTGLNG